MHRLRTMHLFAGAGGGLLADMLLGHRPVAAVEIDEHCQQVLHARQKDDILPWFPIFNNVETFEGRRFKGLVDVIAGGFPCQDISSAGKGEGLEGGRSGLWSAMARITSEVQPRFVFIENSEMLIWRGLDRVINDLECQGFGGAATVVPALFVTGTHVRNRIFILADSSRVGWKWIGCPWTEATNVESGRLGEKLFRQRANDAGIVGTGYGIPNRVDRLKAIGNGQVPAVAALAWEILSNDQN